MIIYIKISLFFTTKHKNNVSNIKHCAMAKSNESKAIELFPIPKLNCPKKVYNTITAKLQDAKNTFSFFKKATPFHTFGVPDLSGFYPRGSKKTNI